MKSNYRRLKNNMDLILKQYGSSRTKPASIIELTCKDYYAELTADLTNMNGFVDENFIQNLRDIADELEEHNNKKKEMPE